MENVIVIPTRGYYMYGDAMRAQGFVEVEIHRLRVGPGQRGYYGRSSVALGIANGTGSSAYQGIVWLLRRVQTVLW